MKQVGSMNDPWAPQSLTNGALPPMHADHVHQLISSDRYLDSLEKKLTKLSSHSIAEPTSRDIVASLSRLRSDQMERFLSESRSLGDQSEVCIVTAATSTYLQRRIFPEKQAVSEEELVVLVQDDVLAKTISEQQDLAESVHVSVAKQQEETISDTISPVAIVTDTTESMDVDAPSWVATFPDEDQ